MGESLPEPMVPEDADLQDFPFVPMFRARLFGSSFHARTSDGGWRAGVTLWLKSWDQRPAGSLPDDDVDLCRLAELGRDLKAWRSLRAEALHGWVLCSDGRLYHPVVAEGVMEAWDRKLRQRYATDCSRIKKSNQRHQRNDPVPTFDEWLAMRRGEVVSLHVPDVSPMCPQGQDGLSSGTTPTVPEDNGQCPQGQRAVSPGTMAFVPGENVSKRQGQGQGQGQGQSKGDSSLRSESPPGDEERDGVDDGAEPDGDAAWCRSVRTVAWCAAASAGSSEAHVRATIAEWLSLYSPRAVRDAIGTAQTSGNVGKALAYINKILLNQRSQTGGGHLRVVAGGARQGSAAEDDARIAADAAACGMSVEEFRRM